MRRSAVRPSRLFARLAGAEAVFVLLPLLAAGTVAPPVRAEGTVPPAQPQTRSQTQPQTQPRKAPAEGSNLILYVVDGLSALEFAHMGYSRSLTPTLDTLMERGLTYTGAYAVSPWTPTSVASLLTSLYPGAHGLRKAGARLLTAANTLPEILKANGYETALFSSHPLVGRLSAFDQGFDRVEEIPGPFYPRAAQGPAETSATLNAKVLAWLGGRTSHAPFFVLVLSEDLIEPYGVPEPHGSHFLTPQEAEWYRGIRRRLLALRPGGLCLRTPEDLKRLGADPKRFARAARDIYDGAIYYVDWQVRLLREGLQARGLTEKTLFVLTSTHGEEFGERGIYGHGASLYDTAVRVPVFMEHPDIWKDAQLLRDFTDQVDLLPTLLSLLGIPIPLSVQGSERSVEPTSESRIFMNRPAFSETSPMGKLPTGRAAMVADAGRKLILYYENPPGLSRPPMEFFRANDQEGWEQRSMAASSPAGVAHLRNIVAGWQSRKEQLALSLDVNPAPPDPKLPEVLRALGYLQGTEPLASPSRASSVSTRRSGGPKP
ncbi:MAG TPA: sulfatase [Candidatus Polarisedimenticolia bacterium]|nr:sulfatase [Candidatus Polarisedimenticolia bacterium]